MFETISGNRFVLRFVIRTSYRSSSPAIMLMEPKVGTMSAIMKPLQHLVHTGHQGKTGWPDANTWYRPVCPVADHVKA